MRGSISPAVGVTTLGNMRTLVVFFAVCVAVACAGNKTDGDWWRTMTLYQIYPRSFKDSDGDGIGDLRGIISKLPYLVESKIDGFWLSPIYTSPMSDFGYDISDFKGIDPIFGNMTDFIDLVKAAHELGLRVIMDLVPNHSSDKHEWFQKSVKGIKPFDDFYVWHEGKKLENGTIVEPNNWVSAIGGRAWTWNEERQMYYMNQFLSSEPDLNYNNPMVVEEMKDVQRFWLDLGVDGFRIDSAAYLCEDPSLRDEPPSGLTSDRRNLRWPNRIYTKDQPKTYDIIKGWTEVLAEYNTTKILMIEAYTNWTSTMKYYDVDVIPFNFGLITNITNNSTANDLKQMSDRWMTDMPKGGVANWVAGNHDNPRVKSRLGPMVAPASTVITHLMPGICVIYNGDEIGMTDNSISWEDTVDPLGCAAGKEGYKSTSRDPARTPFQWDNSTSAGFSTNNKTWLPINPNYKTVNLESEKKNPGSDYGMSQALLKLRKTPIIKNGKLITMTFGNVLSFARVTDYDGAVYVAVNVGNKTEKVNFSKFNTRSANAKPMRLYYSSPGYKLAPKTLTTNRTIHLPPSAVVIYIDDYGV